VMVECWCGLTLVAPGANPYLEQRRGTAVIANGGYLRQLNPKISRTSADFLGAHGVKAHSWGRI
jgi:hypothetical protein